MSPASITAKRELAFEAESWPCGTPPLQDFNGKLADVDVLVSRRDMQQMDECVKAVHLVVASPNYQAQVLALAPELARAQPQRTSGLFSGFDFHLTPSGPKLIEINTNAGGAFYAALISDARFKKGLPEAQPLSHWQALFVAHLRSEWARAGKSALRTVAIVDDQPQSQFLRLEFHVAARMLQQAGITAIIASPEELEYRQDRLWRGSTQIDFVYNRLTSFDLARAVDKPLHDALLNGAAVISPDPRTHALFASKQNLIILGKDERLRDVIPNTQKVTVENAKALWHDRDQYYFKPINGYGSRGVYAGAKLTSKTWNEIVSTDQYIAQEKVDPARIDMPDGQSMRFDIRNFTYNGTVFMRIARVYRGQTTNFRTPNGGFAPVLTNHDPN